MHKPGNYFCLKVFKAERAPQACEALKKSPPEEIYRLFEVSKKAYKRAVGGLYKQRLITIEENGIRLN